MIKQISVIIIIAFCVQLLNNAFFFHTHLSESGKSFSHAHPKSSPNHSHSDFEYSFYSQFELLSSQDLGQLVKDCFYFKIEKHFEKFASRYLEITINNSAGRAPPALIIA